MLLSCVTPKREKINVVLINKKPPSHLLNYVRWRNFLLCFIKNAMACIIFSIYFLFFMCLYQLIKQ